MLAFDWTVAAIVATTLATGAFALVAAKTEAAWTALMGELVLLGMGVGAVSMATSTLVQGQLHICLAFADQCVPLQF